MKDHPITRMRNGEWCVTWNDGNHWFATKAGADRWLESHQRAPLSQPPNGEPEKYDTPIIHNMPGRKYKGKPITTGQRWKRYRFAELDVGDGFVFPEGTAIKEAHQVTKYASDELCRRFECWVETKDPLEMRARRVPDDKPRRKSSKKGKKT